VAHGRVDATFVVLLALLLLTIPLSNIVGLVAETLVERLDALAERDVLLRVGLALSSEPELRTIDDPDIASRLAKVRSRHWEVQSGIRNAQGQLITQVLGLTGSAIALSVVLSWWAALLMVAAAIVEALFFRHTVHQQMDVWSGQTEDQKHARYAFEQAMGKSAKEVRVFGLAGYLRGRHWDNMTAALAPYWRTRWRQSGISLLIGGGRVAVTVSALAYAGSQAANGNLSLTGLATSLPMILTVGSADMWMIGMVERAATTLGWLEELSPDGPLLHLDDVATAPPTTTSPAGGPPRPHPWVRVRRRSPSTM